MTSAERLSEAILFLAGRCDGARTNDGAGFSKWDSGWGHDAADSVAAGKPINLANALRVCTKYRKQLERGGIVLPTADQLIAETPAPQSLPATQPQRRGIAIARRSDGMVAIAFPYDAALVERARSLPGRKFDGATKEWTVPASALGAAIAAFPEAAIDPEILAEAAARLAETQARERSDAARIAADMASLDYMGLGKSLQALVAARALGHRVIVIAPAGLRINWLREAEMAGVQIEIYSWAKCPEPIEEPFTLIADEAHYAQNLKAARTKKFLALAEKAEAVFALTGTPIKNGRPVNLFPLLLATRHALASNRKAYELRYCNTPDAPVWMGDFTFRPIGSVCIGDSVIGWRDNVIGSRSTAGHGRRRLERTTVTNVIRRIASVVRITFESGRSIRCTPEHVWLMVRGRSMSNLEWGRATQGRAIYRAVTVPKALPVGLEWHAGYIAEMLDGEGTLPVIAQSQEKNPEAFTQICRSLEALGFRYSISRGKDKCEKIIILGGRPEYVRLIAWVRPAKLNRAYESKILTSFRHGGSERIVSIVPDGSSEVISLTTGTSNYIVHGLASHNCNAGPTAWSAWDATGATHLDELHRKISDGMLRRMKTECLDLPEKIRVTRKADLSEAARNAYETVLHEKQAEYRRRKAAGEIGEADTLVLMNHLRHAGSIAKVESAVEMAEEILEQGGQVVLFTAFTDSAAQIADALGAGRITGAEDADQRQAAIDAFQSGASKSIVCTLGAGNVGITLTAAQTVILVDRPWTPGDAIQAEDRLHRIGQRGSVLAVWLQANGADEAIDQLLQAKNERIELVLAGKRRTLRGVGSIGEIADVILGVNS